MPAPFSEQTKNGNARAHDDDEPRNDEGKPDLQWLVLPTSFRFPFLCLDARISAAVHLILGIVIRNLFRNILPATGASGSIVVDRRIPAMRAILHFSNLLLKIKMKWNETHPTSRRYHYTLFTFSKHRQISADFVIRPSSTSNPTNCLQCSHRINPSFASPICNKVAEQKGQQTYTLFESDFPIELPL